MVKPSYNHLLLVLLPLCLDAALSLPLIPDDVDDKTRDWSLMMLSPLLANPYNSSQQDVPLMLEGRPYPIVRPRTSYDTHWLEMQTKDGMLHPQASSQTSQNSGWAMTGKGPERLYVPHSPQRSQQHIRAPVLPYPMRLFPQTKRSEGGKIPTMGLGVLSDLRKFFNELRTNLNSVEEVAALSQEQGLSINPEDFLALLAQHEARTQARKGGSGQRPRAPLQNNQLMFGYTPDNQPYAHSGLGK